MTEERAGYTPGPWGWLEPPAADTDCALLTEDETPIFYIEIFEEPGALWFHNVADMHLIAAAPDLYEALTALLAYVEDELADAKEMYSHDENVTFEADDALVERARAALAKARGEG